MIGNQHIDMMKAAARLGSDWALSSMLWQPRDRFVVDEAHFDAVARERPVLAELLRMRRAKRTERIMHAVVALRLGAALGVRVHVDACCGSPARSTFPITAPRGGWRPRA